MINLTPIQRRYLRDEHRFIVVAAGRRSRKTLIAKKKIFKRALINKNTLWFHAAPTRDQAKQIFWDSLKKYTQIYWAKDPNESNLYVTLINGSQIWVVGMDKPQRIEGRDISWNGCHLAEFGDFKPEAWDQNIRPVLADTLGSAIIDGVPDPYKANFSNHRKMSQMASGGSIPIIDPFDGAYAESGEWCFYGWHSADVLDKNELNSIKEETDPQTFRIEYEASFESMAGMVYYGFTPDYAPGGNLDKTIKYDKNLPIVMCFDFNVSPMTAILGHIRNIDGHQEYHAFKGYFLKNSNTKQLIDRIIADYVDTKTFYLTPCQSSIARQSSQEMNADGYRTDLAIIKDAMYEARRNFNINKRSKNPPEHKAIRATNSMLFNNRIKINPDCPALRELQRDFEELTYKEGTTAIDTSDPMRNHISKALSYLCEKYWPIRPQHVEIPDIL